MRVVERAEAVGCLGQVGRQVEARRGEAGVLLGGVVSDAPREERARVCWQRVKSSQRKDPAGMPSSEGAGSKLLAQVARGGGRTY